MSPMVRCAAVLGWLWVLGVLLMHGSGPARACAPAPPPGFDVTIRGEEAVIVWDAEAEREHFIRQAEFETEAEGFGFIVPTPGVPELAEVDSGLFSRLARQTRPRTVHRYETSGVEFGSFFWLSARDGAVDGAPDVQVLRRQQVAGYDAVVLAARDPQALVQWLGEHGYAHTDDLQQWAEPYVDQQWTFTAFKLAAPKGEGGMSTSAVRMSFDTERPVYPYREPLSQRREGSGGDRVLRVFFIAEERYTGDIEGPTSWPAETILAGALPERVLKDYLPQLGVAEPYLTVFLDRSSPRPGVADVYFEPSADPSDVVPEPVVVIRRRPMMLPLELVVLVLGLVGGVVWAVRRRRRR